MLSPLCYTHIYIYIEYNIDIVYRYTISCNNSRIITLIDINLLINRVVPNVYFTITTVTVPGSYTFTYHSVLDYRGLRESYFPLVIGSLIADPTGTFYRGYLDNVSVVRYIGYIDYGVFIRYACCTLCIKYIMCIKYSLYVCVNRCVFMCVFVCVILFN